jgi:hypothetical protein
VVYEFAADAQRHASLADDPPAVVRCSQQAAPLGGDSDRRPRPRRTRRSPTRWPTRSAACWSCACSPTRRTAALALIADSAALATRSGRGATRVSYARRVRSLERLTLRTTASLGMRARGGETGGAGPLVWAEVRGTARMFPRPAQRCRHARGHASPDHGTVGS